MENYWYWLGYNIGGPICLSYAIWVSNELKKHTEITDTFFISRDGWIIKDIFKMLNQCSVTPHYVYASRNIALLHNNDQHIAEYRDYIERECGSVRGKIAIVEGVTMNFSSQRLIERAMQSDVLGLYWSVLNGDNNYQETLCWDSFQKEHYHIIKNWNFVEYIMSSPEPPAISIKDSFPIFKEIDSYERKRERDFYEIQEGVLSFASEYIKGNISCNLDNRCIVKQVNEFLKRPSLEDIENFKNVYFSENNQHSDLIRLDPFLLYEREKKLLKKIKDRIWFVSLRYKLIYTVLHKTKKYIEKVCIPFSNTVIYNCRDDKDFLERLYRYDVVSFDVFDTLLLRKCKKPVNVFDIIGEKLNLSDFRELRCNAEKVARLESDNGEVSIEDIYNAFGNRAGYTIDKLISCELEAEHEVCYANPDFINIVSELHDHNVKIVVTSDMYLHSRQIDSLLRNCGYAYIDNVFVSSDCHYHKADGTLQEYVRAYLGVHNRIVHVGDNYSSDVKYKITGYWDTVYYKRQR